MDVLVCYVTYYCYYLAREIQQKASHFFDLHPCLYRCRRRRLGTSRNFITAARLAIFVPISFAEEDTEVPVLVLKFYYILQYW